MRSVPLLTTEQVSGTNESLMCRLDVGDAKPSPGCLHALHSFLQAGLKSSEVLKSFFPSSGLEPRHENKHVLRRKRTRESGQICQKPRSGQTCLLSSARLLFLFFSLHLLKMLLCFTHFHRKQKNAEGALKIQGRGQGSLRWTNASEG
jgi:hypothetical protein